MRRFGVSTHLFHAERLQAGHLAAIAGSGFEAMELFATKTHFDYHDPAAVRTLAAWLRDAGLEMPSVHAPIVQSLVNDTWGRAYSTATRDAGAWQDMMAEMRAALEIARYIPFSRFEAMFFNDPTAAFAHFRRGLKPGGRLAFVCWRKMGENEWVRLPMSAFKGILPATPPPRGPGSCRWRAARVRSAPRGYGSHTFALPRDLQCRRWTGNAVSAHAIGTAGPR